MGNSFVSVVTPFRNVVSYLSQCIESVLAQSHTNIEYILSDNGSSDGSTAIAESYAKRDRRIRLVRQPQFLSRLLTTMRHWRQSLLQANTAKSFKRTI